MEENEIKEKKSFFQKAKEWFKKILPGKKSAAILGIAAASMATTLDNSAEAARKTIGENNSIKVEQQVASRQEVLTALKNAKEKANTTGERVVIKDPNIIAGLQQMRREDLLNKKNIHINEKEKTAIINNTKVTQPEKNNISKENSKIENSKTDTFSLGSVSFNGKPIDISFSKNVEIKNGINTTKTPNIENDKINNNIKTVSGFKKLQQMKINVAQDIVQKMYNIDPCDIGTRSILNNQLKMIIHDINQFDSETAQKYEKIYKDSVHTRIIMSLADEVIAGKWGKENERKAKLEAAGYNYEEIQSAINFFHGYTPKENNKIAENKIKNNNENKTENKFKNNNENQNVLTQNTSKENNIPDINTLTVNENGKVENINTNIFFKTPITKGTISIDTATKNATVKPNIEKVSENKNTVNKAEVKNSSRITITENKTSNITTTQNEKNADKNIYTVKTQNKNKVTTKKEFSKSKTKQNKKNILEDSKIPAEKLSEDLNKFLSTTTNALDIGVYKDEDYYKENNKGEER